MSNRIRFSNVHQQQLFYWMGYHIDYASGELVTKLDNERRRQYVDALRGAIEKGLWMKTPRVPDKIGDDRCPDKSYAVSRPITCFTEWPLDQCGPHTTRYGRLGLGFPRRFVLDRGGHPLIYVKGTRAGDVVTHSLIALRNFLRTPSLEGSIPKNEIASLEQKLDYLAHFAKRTHEPAPPAPVARGRAKRPEAPTQRRDRLELPGKRDYGHRLLYLEEREWRIVYHAGSRLRKFFTASNGAANAPDYYVPFTTGKDLFTAVLPDNETVRMVMNNQFFVDAFFPHDRPHVTVLSLEDIGTF